MGAADSYGASAQTTFFMGSVGDLTSTASHSGYFMRDGELQRIVEGRRTVGRRSAAGFPETIEIEAKDAAGRELHAVGTCVNRMRMAMPSYICWMNGVTWTVDGEELWGGDDDVPGGRPARHVSIPA